MAGVIGFSEFDLQWFKRQRIAEIFGSPGASVFVWMFSKIYLIWNGLKSMWRVMEGGDRGERACACEGLN